MIQCAAPADSPLSPQHDPLTSPLRTRPAPLLRQGVATPAACPAAAHLTHSPSSSGPNVAHSRSGARWYRRRKAPVRPGWWPETRRRFWGRRVGAARQQPNGALPTAPRASRGPAPFQRSLGRWPVEGMREPGLLATPKQGHVRTGLMGTGNRLGRAGLPASAWGAVAISDAFSSP